MGISTTPLEMVSFKAPEKDIRRKLGINDDEVIVSAIAIGYPMETNNLTCGARRSANDIAIKY